MKLFKKYISNDNKHTIYNCLGIKFKFKNNVNIIQNINRIQMTDIFKTTEYIRKKIDIIVPVYNGFEYLGNLLNQIRDYTDLDYELYVVDDKSPDERILPLLKKYETIFNGNMHLIENETNLGFLKTVNKALKLTKNDVCIINTDVQLPKNWATRLMYYIFKNNKVASVTPFSNAATIFSFPKMWVDNNLKIDYNLVDKVFCKLSLDTIPLLEFPTGVGFCMAMSRKALNKIGVFDEIFEKGYCEENDWCMRALRAGFKNVLCPNLFVYHKHGGSFDSQEKKQLCEKHLSIINNRYPEYFNLLEISSNNKIYLKFRKILMKFYYYAYFITILQSIFSIKKENLNDTKQMLY